MRAYSYYHISDTCSISHTIRYYIVQNISMTADSHVNWHLKYGKDYNNYRNSVDKILRYR